MRIARRYGAAVTNVYSHALNGYAAKVPEQALPGIRHDPRVAFVEQDYVQHAADQKLPTGINRIEGDLSSTKAGNGLDTVNADIAVLDTGIQKDHPDLNVAGGYNCTSSDRSNYGDGHGHGTHVAGIAAAYDNDTGVVGAAPGAGLWAMKVLTDSGTGYTSWIICGIDRVTAMNTDANPDNNIEVANMSLAGSGGDSTCNSIFDPYHKAICNSTKAGVTYAVAAGNSNTDLKNSRPATYDQVLAVTAVADFNGVPGGGAVATCRADVDDTSADFSNFTTVGHADANHTIAAPGVCIESTWKGSTYNTISGTSMASPHVAGTAALCIATSGTTGKCTGGPSDVMSDLRSDAEARSNDPAVSPYYGFADDPKTPNGSRYYGYLEYAGSY